MKLPGIRYDIRVNLGREDISAPARLHQARQGAIETGIRLAEDMRDMRTRSQINEADMEMSIFESDLRKKYEGNLWAQSDQLPDYLDIKRTDSEGNPVEIPMSDVWPEIYRKEMENKAKSLAEGIGDRRASQAWGRQARTQIEGRFQGHQASAQRQIQAEAAEMDSISIGRLVDNQMFGQAEILASQSMALTEPEKRKQIGAIHEARDEYYAAEIETQFQARADQIAASARDGQPIETEKQSLFGELDDLHFNGMITSRQRDSMKRQVKQGIFTESEIGENRRLVNDDKPEEAFNRIEVLRDQKPKHGMTVEEWDEFTDALYQDTNRTLQIKQAQEAEEDNSQEKRQKINSQNLYNRLIDPEDRIGMNEILAASKRGDISQSQADKLIAVYESRGSGVDDPVVVNAISQMIAENADPMFVQNMIMDQTGLGLTEATASELQLSMSESRIKGGPLTSESFKSARMFLQNATEVTGELGSIDPGSSKRWALMEREMRERVLAGEDPWAVADELIPKGELMKLNKNMEYGKNLDGSVDIARAKQELDQAYQAGMTKNNYNFYIGELNKIQQLQQSINAINEGRRNVTR